MWASSTTFHLLIYPHCLAPKFPNLIIAERPSPTRSMPGAGPWSGPQRSSTVSGSDARWEAARTGGGMAVTIGFLKDCFRVEFKDNHPLTPRLSLKTAGLSPLIKRREKIRPAKGVFSMVPLHSFPDTILLSKIWTRLWSITHNTDIERLNLGRIFFILPQDIEVCRITKKVFTIKDVVT